MFNELYRSTVHLHPYKQTQSRKEARPDGVNTLPQLASASGPLTALAIASGDAETRMSPAR